MPAPDVHVLMTADAVGGVWTFALDLAHAITAAGGRVSLAVLGPPPSDDQQRDVSRLPGVELYSCDCRLEWMDEPWDDVDRSGAWLLDLARRLQPTVVHLNGYSHAALPWPAPILVTAHSCVLSWWTAVHRELPPARYEGYRRRVAAGLAAAHLVTAPTEAMRAALDVHYGPVARARVIPNGRSAPPPASAQKEPLIFSAGRVWDEAKNLRLLCGLAARLPWPVRVAGDCTRRETGESYADSGPQFLGRRSADEVAGWMARASIYALPARYEPFGLSVLEAAQAGCALVLGDTPSLREVWGDAALYVDPEDGVLLEATLLALIQNGALREDMRRRAQQRAAAYSDRRMGHDYLTVYRELAGEDRPLLSFSAL